MVYARHLKCCAREGLWVRVPPWVPKERMKIKNEANETIKAGCVVVDKDGQILAVTNPKRSNWLFPKGHTEAGETAEDAATRETLEETGWKVNIVKPLPDLAYAQGETGEMIRVAMFLAEPVKKIQESGESTKWLPIDEAKQKLYPNLVEYLHQIDLSL